MSKGRWRAGDEASLAHYQSPAYYWRTYARRKRDILYYLELARSHGSVLEYGIGNGRIALPLAEGGVCVTGIELSIPMLKDLRARLARKSVAVRSRVEARHGDMTKLRLNRRFPLVIAPFNAILHLYQIGEVERFLARVHDHLAVGGEFAFDVSVPQPDDLCREPSRAYKAPPVRHPDTGQRLAYQERFEYEPDRQLLSVWCEFSNERGQLVGVVPLTQRQFFPAELEALLWYNGFSEIRLVPDFGSPRPGGVDSLVFRCRAESSENRPAAER